VGRDELACERSIYSLMYGCWKMEQKCHRSIARYIYECRISGFASNDLSFSSLGTTLRLGPPSSLRRTLQSSFRKHRMIASTYGTWCGNTVTERARRLRPTTCQPDGGCGSWLQLELAWPNVLLRWSSTVSKVSLKLGGAKRRSSAFVPCALFLGCLA
jgi:hypothetical protein